MSATALSVPKCSFKDSGPSSVQDTSWNLGKAKIHRVGCRLELGDQCTSVGEATQREIFIN